MIFSGSGNFYFTDSRYTHQARKALGGSCMVIEFNGSFAQTISSWIKKLKFKSIAFEERKLSYAEYQLIRKGLDYYQEMIPTFGIVESLRAIKTAFEIAKIRRAVDIAIEAFGFAAEVIKPEVKEIEVCSKLESFIRCRGATGASFQIIVASGENSSFPHHISSSRKIKNNEPVLLDMGADYQGYKSDLTRVFFLGKIKNSFSNIYNVVLEAQKKAIQALQNGQRRPDKIDEVARDHIKNKGFGRFFKHSLGHGVGLEVHESPNLSKYETSCLKPGMVFTVEPAIYLPGKFGVRIEDMCLITKNKVEVLSGALNK